MNQMYTDKERFPIYTMLRQDEDVAVYISEQNRAMKELHYTEHSFAHVGITAQRAADILTALQMDDHTIDLALSASWLHDIGNIVNRAEHSQSGAVMAFQILNRLGVPARDIAPIVCAIGNHDEGTGVPVSDVSAAVILADKSDVRRSRVQEEGEDDFDIHDRVNFAVTESQLEVGKDGKITLILSIDTKWGEIGEYFQIFMPRMLMCKTAAEYLNLDFDLIINGQKMM